MENKQQRPIFLGFSSQKGGVGKSTLAEIVSSILYYEQGINLFVVDCDLSQDSFYKLREREKSVIQGSEELSKSMQAFFQHLGKKAYRIYKSSPKEAVKTAQSKIDAISNEKYQLVVFDFPGHAGTTELMELSLQMDYILSPLEADIQSLVSCMAYAKTITDIGVSMSDSRIKDIILFWNKVDRRVRNVIIDEYTKLIQGHELTLLPGYVYATHRFSHELSTYGLRGVFRSTYQPPAKGLRTGTGLDELVSEIIQRLKLKTKTATGKEAEENGRGQCRGETCHGSQPLRSIRGHRAFPRNITRGRQKFGRNEDGKRRTNRRNWRRGNREHGTEKRKKTENRKVWQVVPFHRGIPFPILSSRTFANADGFLHQFGDITEPAQCATRLRRKGIYCFLY